MKDKLGWANNLRAFATIGVIMLHVASTISLTYPAISKSFFLTSVFFDAAMRCCVPVFIMLSGSFALNNYDGRFKVFFIKLFYRIILPFLFWSIVYLFFFSWNELRDTNKSFMQLSSFVLEQFIVGTASHLWFVYVIISLYLIFPILSHWTKVATEKEYLFFMFLWIGSILINPFLSNYDTSFDISFFSGFLGFIVLGSYLFKTARRINSLLLITIFVAAFLFTAIQTYLISVHANELNETYMDNLSINVCLMAFSVYSLFKNESRFLNKFIREMIDLICKHSFGIYLSHLLILNVFLKIGWRFDFIHPLIGIPIITITCLIISWLLIVLMKKIPVLKLIAG
jgi:surface polysaccharide O-acyltransferase-like enzyme